MSEEERQVTPSYWRTIKPWWDRISIYDGPDCFLREFASAPEPVRHLFAAHWIQSEVRNGGFNQFFSNSTGVLAPEAEQGFRAIGMLKAADVIAAQIAAFGPLYPRDRHDRERFLEKRNGLPSVLLEVARLGWLTMRGATSQPGDEEFWALLDNECGGFQAAADRFAVESDPDLA